MYTKQTKMFWEKSYTFHFLVTVRAWCMLKIEFLEGTHSRELDGLKNGSGREFS